RTDPVGCVRTGGETTRTPRFPRCTPAPLPSCRVVGAHRDTSTLRGSMTQSTLAGTGPWSWLEPGLWVYRSRELDLLGQADGLLADAVPAAKQGGPALLEAKRRLHAAGVGAATAPAPVGGG